MEAYIMNNQLIYIRRNLYILRKDYGKPIDIYSKTSTLNYQTGKQTVIRSKIRIRKAIILPNVESLRGRQIYEQAFLSSGKPGSSFEVLDRTAIIESRDIPKGFKLNIGDYVIIDQRSRYEIKTITDYEFDTGIILGLKEAKGAPLFQIIEQFHRDKIKLNQVVSYQL